MLRSFKTGGENLDGLCRDRKSTGSQPCQCDFIAVALFAQQMACGYSCIFENEIDRVGRVDAEFARRLPELQAGRVAIHQKSGNTLGTRLPGPHKNDYSLSVPAVGHP